MISTHILDTSKGSPAEEVTVILEYRQEGQWQTLEKGVTNTDGRYKFLAAKNVGDYRITFMIEDYLQDSFFLNTPVAFKVQSTDRNYHVPLLLNPFGYSTYRGS